MSISRAVITKNLQLDAGYDRGTGMKLKIYSGSVPATADTALGAQVLLAGLVLASTPFAAATGGTKTAGAIAPDVSADATGTATFFRLTKSDDTVVSQGSVTASGGGGDAIINSTAVVSGTTVSCSSLVMTAGA